MRELDTAVDRAATLDTRLGGTERLGTGPLPWLPGIPPRLADHPTWGSYLAALVRANAAMPILSGRPTHRPLPDSLIGDIQVWRAANQIEAPDRRLTGTVQISQATRDWQQRLDQRLAAGSPSPDD